MTIDTNQFWNLISESQLLPVQQVQTLFSEFSSDDSNDKSAVGLAKWMVKKKTISGYQAKILLAGHSGPFRMGKYTLVDRIEAGLMKGHFAAQHTRTKYPVLLQFLEGNQPKHLTQWNQIESLTYDLTNIRHPNVVETFESVVLPDRRFVVSQHPNGDTLSDKIPRKARLPWKLACGLIAQAANGLDQFHAASMVHGAVSPRTIWINNKGVQLRLNPFPDPDFQKPDKALNGNESFLDYLAPECWDDPKKPANTHEDESVGNESDQRESNASPASDIYSLGCTLFRAISGKPPFPDLDPEKKKSDHRSAPLPDLKRFELPGDLDTLLKKMLAKDPKERPKANEVFNLLALHSGKANELKTQKATVSSARLKFRRSLTEFVSDIEPESVAATPEIATGEREGAIAVAAAPSIELSQTEETAVDRGSKIKAAALAAERRKKGRWKVPAAIAASLLVLAGIIGGAAYMAGQTTVKKEETKGETSAPDEDPKPKNDPKETDVPNTEPENPNLVSVESGVQPRLRQSLIDDDLETLWESPTTGAAVDFSSLPLSPKMLISLRPAELLEDPEGERVLKSLGPEFSSKLERLKSRSGLDFENIEQLIISLHTNESFEYEPYFVVKTPSPVAPDRMLQLWNGPALSSLENGQEIYESKDGSTAFYVLHGRQSQPVDSGSVDEAEPNETKKAVASSPITRFAFGNKALIREVALAAGSNVISGSLLKLSQRTDSDRHFNMLFLRNGLFNDEGQKMMGEQMGAFNRELRVMIPDDVRGGLVSLHIDSGNYFEIMLDRNFDLKAPDLKQIMKDETRTRRDLLMQFVSRIPPNAYWDQVRFRYASMLTDFNKNLRWNVENGEVVANCWLPPMAAHNLLAASELVITFASGGSDSAVPAKSGPKSLEELLALKRDLNIANPPDLNVLMADLQSEVQDDLGKLPFAFNIRLIGGDLEADGITKNQRPPELEIEQKSLGEILTAIMVGANPDKDITGANDPNCQLIWVVADDPENPGQKAILITTRKAAAQKSYQLPAAFQTE